MNRYAFRKSLTTAACAATLLVAGCAGVSFTTTADDIASAASLAAGSIGNKTASDYLYALADVATAYGKAPVPTDIATATAPISPALVATVLPLITGKNNNPKTQALINGAAALLATMPNATPAATSAALITYFRQHRAEIASLHLRFNAGTLLFVGEREAG
jgi:hypothetical protein